MGPDGQLRPRCERTGEQRQTAWLRQLDDRTLARQRRSPLVLTGERLCSSLESLQRAVGAARVMMEQEEAPSADGTHECDCVRDARMAPAQPLFVLVFEVLRVVQEQVDVVSDRR